MSRSHTGLSRIVASALLIAGLASVAGCVVAPPPVRIVPAHRVWHHPHYRWDGAQWILIPGHYVWVR